MIHMSSGLIVLRVFHLSQPVFNTQSYLIIN